MALLVFTQAANATTKAAAKTSAKTKASAKTEPEAKADTPRPANASALDALKKANDRLRKIVGKQAPSWSPQGDAKTAEVKKVIGDFLDFEELSRRALAKHWDGLAAKQRTEFIGTLRSLVERNYVSSIHGQPDYDLRLEKEEMTGNDATVTGTLHATRKGKKIKIALDYRMVWKSGKWVVYDVITDEVSLLENYRTEFGKIINKDGFAALLDKMKKKLAEKG